MKTGPDRRYTAEFRDAAVKQVEVGGRSIVAVARSLEMSSKTLANWVYRARRGQVLVSREAAQPTSELQAELSRLRQENARLKLEREILKKAAAYFAKESM
jgi:transposase